MVEGDDSGGATPGHPVVLGRAAIEDWAFPRSAAGLELVLAHGERLGLTRRVLLAGTGLEAAWGTRPGERPAAVTAAQELRVVRTLQRLRPHGAAALGASYRAATFGALGYALATSRTVLDLVDLFLRYVDLSHAFVVPQARLEGDTVEVVLEGATIPADVRSYLVERDAVAIVRVLRELAPTLDADLVVGPERALLRFPLAGLEVPVTPGDVPVERATAEAWCDALAQARRDLGPATREVRVVIAQRLLDGARAVDVAAHLGWSERTLRRRLGAEGTTHQQQLDAVRSALAAQLLAPPAALEVQEVARRLGYADATTFIRAHRRWTGRTPGRSTTRS
ncbi:helix-turn-helix domain-containing protein [Nocardioides sp. TRM66260-LWL]|uniref:helix-turn-helix domain-containing protein n=1 Tax=Nocardioides sp. TRM66260-LWL TaxID=2874478 RepID=UPI001CC6618A|nr:helix-turn-helix domain-containing protein [Nocardioides sp. TRM66260-LWL]MBZ5735885.1 helix-turn-helix domain-containing protein [Nocardioides sp. TRM66260-LWL]